MLDLIGIGLFLFLAWFVYDSAKAKQTASKAAAVKCQVLDLQFLDQTVALKQIKLKRSISGALVLSRVYSFEYSVSGTERQGGRIYLFGREVERVKLDIENSVISV